MTAATSAIEVAERHVEEPAEVRGSVLGRDVLAAGAPLLGERLPVGECREDRLSELVLREAGRDVPSPRATHELLGATRRRDDGGDAARERLGDADPEALLAGGRDEQSALAEERRDVGHDAGRLDPGAERLARRRADQTQPRGR